MVDALIRPARSADLSALNEIYNHYAVATSTTFDVEASSLEARRTWFETFSEQGRHRLFTAERDGRIVGYAAGRPFRPKPAYDTSIETSVYLEPESTGTGIGTALYSALFDALVGQDLHRAYAGITLPNPASIALHRRFDFEAIGIFREAGRKLGRYWDVQWFEKGLD